MIFYARANAVSTPSTWVALNQRKLPRKRVPVQLRGSVIHALQQEGDFPAAVGPTKGPENMVPSPTWVT